MAFVVGNIDNLSQEEDDIAAFMDDIGLLTDTVDDNDNARDFLRDVGLVVISSSANENEIQDDYDSSVPVVVLNPDTFVEMQMVEDRGATQGIRNARLIEVEDDGHPIAVAAGLRRGDRVEVFDVNVQMNFGEAEGDAEIVASIDGNSRQAAIFTYDFGAELARDRLDRNREGRTAKNRRVGFFLRENAFNDMQNDGEDLFEAALTWAYNGRATVGTVLR